MNSVDTGLLIHVREKHERWKAELLLIHAELSDDEARNHVDYIIDQHEKLIERLNRRINRALNHTTNDK